MAVKAVTLNRQYRGAGVELRAYMREEIIQHPDAEEEFVTVSEVWKCKPPRKK